MSPEELAKHRQEYWEALSKGLDDCRYGLPFTEEEKREVFSHIKDSEIIHNVEKTVKSSTMWSMDTRPVLSLIIIYTSRQWYIKK